MQRYITQVIFMSIVLCLATWVLTGEAQGEFLLNLGEGEMVQVGDPQVDLDVCGGAAPCWADWNDDGKMDFIVGEGMRDCYEGLGRVRVYLNQGTVTEPQFIDYFYVQANGSDLEVSATAGCMGAVPRVVYWNNDALKDLLLGLGDGTLMIFLNVATNQAPAFDAGQTVLVGPYGSEQPLDAGVLAGPEMVDWNNDGMKDLVVGAYDGKMHVYLNCGCVPGEMKFYTSAPEGLFMVQENDGDLIVPLLRSSPVVMDLNEDGKKDILTSDTEGQLLFYENVATDAAPTFSGHVVVDANNVPIDLPLIAKAKPFVCDWTGDGHLDVMIGHAYSGMVYLYQGVPIPFCGDSQHQPPVGDLSGDCIVDIRDFAMMGAHWMECTKPECDD